MFHNSTFVQRGSARTAVLIIGVIIGIILLISFFVVTNIDDILSWKPVEKLASVVEEGKGTIENILAMKNDLSEQYPAQKIRINFNYGSGGDGNTLKINFIRPEFIKGEYENAEYIAREIALFVYENFESRANTDRITIIFKEKGGIIAGLLNENEFTFDVSDLVPQEHSILHTTDQPESTGLTSKTPNQSG